MSIRKLENTKNDRSLLRIFDRKLARFEKTLDPNLIVDEIRPNDIYRVLGLDTTAVFVFEEEGIALGYIVGKIKKFPKWYGVGNYGYIECIFTEEYARGRGVAAELFSVCKQWFVEKQVRTIKLKVFSSNPAGGLYKKWGFKSLVEEMILEQ